MKKKNKTTSVSTKYRGRTKKLSDADESGLWQKNKYRVPFSKQRVGQLIEETPHLTEAEWRANWERAEERRKAFQKFYKEWVGRDWREACERIAAKRRKLKPAWLRF